MCWQPDSQISEAIQMHDKTKEWEAQAVGRRDGTIRLISQQQLSVNLEEELQAEYGYSHGNLNKHQPITKSDFR